MKGQLAGLVTLTLLSACAIPPELSANWFLIAGDSDCSNGDADQIAACKKAEIDRPGVTKMQMKLVLLNRSADWVKVNRLWVNPPQVEKGKDLGWVWLPPLPPREDSPATGRLSSGEILVVDLNAFIPKDKVSKQISAEELAPNDRWDARCRVPIHVAVSMVFPSRRLWGDPKDVPHENVPLLIRNPMPTALPANWASCSTPDPMPTKVAK